MDVSDLQKALLDAARDSPLQTPSTDGGQRGHKKLSHGAHRRKSISCPVHRLPPELLIQTFQLGLQPHEWSMERMWSLARVCKQWNSIILSTPSLWAVINGACSLREMEIAARKSESMPLAIIYQYGIGTSWAELLEVLRSNESPWWMVDIEAPGGFFVWAQPVFARPNPSLSHIRLLSANSLGPPFPWLILSEGCPIRSLDVRCVSLNWDSPRLTGLIKLRLIYTTIITEARLATILTESPRLEELFLNSIPLFSSPEWSCKDPIPLKDLQSLHLEAIGSTFNRILTLLRLPSHTRVKMEHVDVSDLTKGEDPVLFRIVPPILPFLPCIRVRFTEDRCSIAVKPDSKNKTRYDIRGRHGGIRSLFDPMSTGCWAAYVTKLEIELPQSVEDVALDGMARLDNLESLKVSGGSWVLDVLSSLSQPQQTKLEERFWPNPRLISLNLAFRSAESYSGTGTSFLPTHASAVSDLVQKRWKQVADTAEDASRLAALSSLIIRVPEDLDNADSVEALATMACESARVLGYGVLRIISIE